MCTTEGECVGINPCAEPCAAVECATSSCATATGCVYTRFHDTNCDDGNAMTENDVCTVRARSKSNKWESPIIVISSSSSSSCCCCSPSPFSHSLSSCPSYSPNPPKPQNGECGGQDVCLNAVCQAMDECHEAGECIGKNLCTNPVKPLGTACTGGFCVNGACQPPTPPELVATNNELEFRLGVTE